MPLLLSAVLDKASIRKIEALYDDVDKSTSNVFLVVSSKQQKLYLIQEGTILDQYLISTASAGLGNESGSYKTPLGLHRIQEKIGHNAKSASIFKARKNTQRLAEILTGPNETSDADNITSRILWLAGLEEGINQGYDAEARLVDSYQRYIYIHGTDEEGKLGKPSSHGCVRMANSEVIDLFSKVEEGCLVLMT